MSFKVLNTTSIVDAPSIGNDPVLPPEVLPPIGDDPVLPHIHEELAPTDDTVVLSHVPVDPPAGVPAIAHCQSLMSFNIGDNIPISLSDQSQQKGKKRTVKGKEKRKGFQRGDLVLVKEDSDHYIPGYHNVARVVRVKGGSELEDAEAYNTTKSKAIIIARVVTKVLDEGFFSIKTHAFSPSQVQHLEEPSQKGSVAFLASKGPNGTGTIIARDNPPFPNGRDTVGFTSREVDTAVNTNVDPWDADTDDTDATDAANSANSKENGEHEEDTTKNVDANVDLDAEDADANADDHDAHAEDMNEELAPTDVTVVLSHVPVDPPAGVPAIAHCQSLMSFNIGDNIPISLSDQSQQKGNKRTVKGKEKRKGFHRGDLVLVKEDSDHYIPGYHNVARVVRVKGGSIAIILARVVTTVLDEGFFNIETHAISPYQVEHLEEPSRKGSVAFLASKEPNGTGTIIARDNPPFPIGRHRDGFTSVTNIDPWAVDADDWDDDWDDDADDWDADADDLNADDAANVDKSAVNVADFTVNIDDPEVLEQRHLQLIQNPTTYWNQLMFWQKVVYALNWNTDVSKIPNLMHTKFTPSFLLGARQWFSHHSNKGLHWCPPRAFMEAVKYIALCRIHTHVTGGKNKEGWECLADGKTKVGPEDRYVSVFEYYAPMFHAFLYHRREGPDFTGDVNRSDFRLHCPCSPICHGWRSTFWPEAATNRIDVGTSCTAGDLGKQFLNFSALMDHAINVEDDDHQALFQYMDAMQCHLGECFRSQECEDYQK